MMELPRIQLFLFHTALVSQKKKGITALINLIHVQKIRCGHKIVKQQKNDSVWSLS